mgnify:CR=1 FL=1
MRYGVPFLPYTLLQASKVGDAPQALRPLSVSDALSQESGERTINENQKDKMGQERHLCKIKMYGNSRARQNYKVWQNQKV